MAECGTEEVLNQPVSGEPLGTKELFQALYSELHTIAEHNLRRGGSELTLGPTTLIHEAYLSVAACDAAVFPDEPRFLGYASRAMRGLVIDYVRRRHAKKRGRELEITLTGQEPLTEAADRSATELEQIGDAMDELSAVQPDLADLVDLHFFCGYTFAEIAALRGVSERTVQRDWRKARLLLYRAVIPAEPEGSPLQAVTESARLEGQ